MDQPGLLAGMAGGEGLRNGREANAFLLQAYRLAESAMRAAYTFDARHHWSGSSRSIWSKSSSALGALEEVERRRREAVVPSDR